MIRLRPTTAANAVTYENNWWARLGSNQRPSACEMELGPIAFCLCWSEACEVARLDVLEHLARLLGPILALWNPG